MNFSRAPRLPIVMAGAVAIAGVLLASSQACPAHAATARTAAAVTTKTDATKPTIVLVHGAWADSGSWDAVTRILQDDGYTVYAPPTRSRAWPTTPPPSPVSCTASAAPSCWDRAETARQREIPQLAGRFRRWWQVMGSNHRRLSRRFYSPLLLPESPR